MSLPRQILPGAFYMLTRRCAQRQFLLRPSRRTNDVFRYCLALAAQRTGVQLLLAVVMSNHYHAVVHDPDGRVVDFYQQLHLLTARAMNRLRRRREGLWATEAMSLVALPDRDAVLDKLVYVATNPIKARLVARIHHWPGVHTLADLLDNRTSVAVRPATFFRRRHGLPLALALASTIPAALGPAAAFRAELAARVDAEVDRLARLRGSAPVLGRAAVLKQDPLAFPARDEPAGSLRPRFASRSRWLRRQVRDQERAFLDAYRAARVAWLAGVRDVCFPPGTYWLHRFADVKVAPLA